MAKKDEKRVWKLDKALIITLLAVVIGFIIWFFYVGSPKEIVSVADQFKPGTEWKLTQDHVEPPRSFCVDVSCPSVSRTWESAESLTKEDLESLLRQAGWKLTPEKDCFKITADRPSSWCDVEDNVGNFLITVSVSNKRSLDDKSTIRLLVRD